MTSCSLPPTKKKKKINFAEINVMLNVLFKQKQQYITNFTQNSMMKFRAGDILKASIGFNLHSWAQLFKALLA